MITQEPELLDYRNGPFRQLLRTGREFSAGENNDELASLVRCPLAGREHESRNSVALTAAPALRVQVRMPEETT
jgi:hypothetical protein